MNTTRLQDKIGQAIRAVAEAQSEALGDGWGEYDVKQCHERLQQALDALRRAEHHAKVADEKEPA